MFERNNYSARRQSLGYLAKQKQRRRFKGTPSQSHPKSQKQKGQAPNEACPTMAGAKCNAAAFA